MVERESGDRERARLFFALDPDAPTRAALAAWRQKALGGREELRLPGPESLHVTLAFLGARDEATIEALARAGLSAVAGRSPVVLRARRVVAVPRRRPRLLALDLDDLEGGPGDVATAVAGALAGAGLYEPGVRAFWPHVTLARVRGKRAGGPLPAPPAIPFAFDRVTLYRSHLSPAGARYEAVECRRLVRA